MTIMFPGRPDFTSISGLSDPRVLRSRYCSPKLDGNFTYLCKDEFGTVKVFSRTKKEITDKVRTSQFYLNFHAFWKGPITVMGELWKKGVPCSSISTYLAEGKPLQYWAFAVHGVGSMDITREYIQERNLPSVPYIEGPFSNLQLEQYWDVMKVVFDPADGLVFSDGPGTEYFKWKPSKTIDLILKTWVKGKGKYANTLGKLVLATADGHVVAAVSGMTDTERHWIKDNFESLRGKIVEVRYNSVGSQGRLRHPRFLRFREDKFQSECRTSQDPDLKRYWDES